MDNISIKKLLSHQIVEGELYSFQIISILLALENLAGINNYGIQAYQGWIRSRGKRDPFQSSINLAILARSFEINGFSQRFPIEVDPDDLMLNGGTHRTACSLFYNIENIPIEFRTRTGETKKSPKYYGINYFKSSNCFSETIIDNMEKRWDEIVKNLGLLK